MQAIAGAALFFIPWVWLALVLAAARAVLRGPGAWRSWLPICLAAPPIVLLSLVPAWSGHRALYHWTAPGYLMLFPLLGSAIAARLERGDRAVRLWVGATAALVVLGAGFVGVEMRFGVLPAGMLSSTVYDEGRDWTALRDDLAARGLLADPGLVATLRWQDSGKADYALHGAAKVITLSTDQRQYGFAPGPAALAGRDAVVIAAGNDAAKAEVKLAKLFARVELLPSADGFALFIGRDLRWPPGE